MIVVVVVVVDVVVVVAVVAAAALALAMAMGWDGRVVFVLVAHHDTSCMKKPFRIA